jgi:flagellar biosynthetic protein FlhB
MADSAEERTEQPTPKRLREARRRGQVPRSRELSTAAVVGAAVVAMASSSTIAAASIELFKGSLHPDPALLAEPGQMPAAFGRVLLHGLLILAPLFAGTFVGAFVSPVLLGGWNFSAAAIVPDFSRLNPMSGFGRVFSVQGLFELVKSVAKFSLIGAVSGVFLWRHLDDLMGLGIESGPVAIQQVFRLMVGTLEWGAAALVMIAVIDAPYQRWNFIRQMKMTRQEVRDEYKQSEGRPEVKGRMRRLQQEMSRRRMLEKVPTADVVVTNPTHYAVALKYESDKMRAPVVIAKGAGEVAASIRELASKNRVPLVSAPPLARALYRSVELDEEIPIPLYAAVAKVLTYIYQLRNWQGGNRPTLADIGKIPGGEPDPD